MLNELCALFRRNFPYAVRSDGSLKEILGSPANRVLARRDKTGALYAAAVIREAAVLMLCVDEAYRRQGVGSALLEEAEAIIRASGHRTATIGVGETYLTPGVPVREMPFPETLSPMAIDQRIPAGGADFFRRRGYAHSHGDSNCFDMRMDITDAVLTLPIRGKVRWAEIADLPAVLDCARDAYEEFAPYYNSAALYQADALSRVLIATDGEQVAGAVIVGFGEDMPGLGSLGCTLVRPACRGRGTATDMVIAGVQAIYRAGLQQGFLSYTYSGLDRLYGSAGFAVSCLYFMAEKPLA